MDGAFAKLDWSLVQTFLTVAETGSLSEAARKLGIKAAIVMPRNAPKVKLDATEALGAEIILYDRPGEDRDEIAAREIDKRGAVLVHAFADPWVIEGQGSAGIEITRQLGRQPSKLVACCGGGGLSAGLALACPDSAIALVEPEGWDDVCRSLETGEIQSIDDPPPTACDALQTFATRPINFDILRERASEWARATEAEIRTAQRFAFGHLNLVVEPGGAAALAAALAGKVAVDEDTVIMVTGGNTDAASFAATITDR